MMSQWENDVDVEYWAVEEERWRMRKREWDREKSGKKEKDEWESVSKWVREKRDTCYKKLDRIITEQVENRKKDRKVS